MKHNLLIFFVIIGIMTPGVSHGFGLMKYVWDGVANQLGLDRGPVPKGTPTRPPGMCRDAYEDRVPRHVHMRHFHLQAGGF